MEDHHVDRPGVKAQQCVQPTGTNRSFGLIDAPSHAATNASCDHSLLLLGLATEGTSSLSSAQSVLRRPGGYGEEIDTRSHPELGRENPQRRWYCVLRRGRVGRRQVFPEQINRPQKTYSCPRSQLPPRSADNKQHRACETTKTRNQQITRGGAAR